MVIGAISSRLLPTAAGAAAPLAGEDRFVPSLQQEAPTWERPSGAPDPRSRLEWAVEVGVERAQADWRTLREDIATGATRGMCGTFCWHLQTQLKAMGYEVEHSTNRHRDGNGHYCLACRVGGQTLLVDPTIGQFVQGYHRVFVGTPAELRDLILHPDTVLINSRSAQNPPEMLLRTWGLRPDGSRAPEADGGA